MNKLLSFVCAMVLSIGVTYGQTIDELKKERDEKAAQQAELQGQANALAGEVASLNDQILKMSGWQTGLNGILGLTFNQNSQWQGQDNKSAGFNFGLTAFANNNKEKSFWNNKGILNKAWQDVDKAGDTEDDNLFDESNSTADIININSLYGYKLSDNFALSAMGEVNTTLADFLSIGTLDLGLGATWTPVNNLVVVIHPLNYHTKLADLGTVDTNGLGAKIRADYTKSFPIGNKSFNWSSTFTTFLPYADNDPNPSLSEYQWLNNLSFTIWKGIGVGVGFGIRDAALENDGDVQSFYTIGLSYGF